MKSPRKKAIEKANRRYPKGTLERVSALLLSTRVEIGVIEALLKDELISHGQKRFNEGCLVTLMEYEKELSSIKKLIDMKDTVKENFTKKGKLLVNANTSRVRYEEIEVPCKKMCKTCAYRTPISDLEKEAEKDIFVERGNQPHACHDDNQYYCRGSW